MNDEIFLLVDLAKSPGKIEAMLRAGIASPGAALAAYGDAGALTDGGRVALDILLADGVDAAAAAAALAAAGMSGVAVVGRAASGWIDAELVGALEDVAEIAFARATYGIADAGAVGDEGSRAVNADVGRLDFGVDGAGVAVGVLSDSFDALGGAAADRASGDLPAVTVLRDASGTDEGRAMAQIVHDVAPGADLLFHTASGGQAAFAQGILNLVAAGADVIVDDIVYLGEPFFQDGLVARAVDAAAAAGVAYFSSAGNAARDSYEAAFAGSGQDLALLGSAGFIDFGELHDFDDGAGVDVRQRVSIPRGGDIFLSFQWDEPFASVSENGRGSASDYDILLFGADGDLVTSNLFAISAGFNIGADPVEAFRFVNRTATTEFDIVITHFSGPEAGVLKYIELGDATIVEHDTNSSASFGHAPAEGGMGVGAAFWGLTPSNGVEVPVLESFSSAGPATILFDDAGVRLAEAERRASPDVVGPDGTNNTFFGRDIGFDADTSPNFFGTSAAAPHVAAVAALLLEANPNLTPQAIYAILEETAIDMGAPGVDEDSGFGLVDAAAALAAVAAGLGRGTAFADLLVGAADADFLEGLDGDDVLNGGGGDDLLVGGAGADRLDGGAGADVMDGGEDDDVYVVDDAGDVIVDDGGVDTVESAIDYRLGGGIENLVLTGAADLNGFGDPGANVMQGNGGANLLNGLFGDDAIAGGAGSDRLVGHSGDDRLDGGDDMDVLRGDAGADDMAGGAANDRLFGGSGDDVLAGGDGADFLDGSGGADVYEGGAGADRLSSRLDGMEDVFRFSPGSGADRIFRYEAGVDRIALSADFGFLDGADAIANMTAAVVNDAGHAILNLNGADVIQLINFVGLNPGAALAALADDIAIF